jgi:hypothetical protein
VDDLALQIGQRHHVVIDDAKRADAGRGKIEQHWRTEAAGADNQHPGAAERRLARPADLAQYNVARVTFKLVVAEHAVNILRQPRLG